MTLQRGCGTRKADSFYLTAKVGCEGKAPVQWALGVPLANNGCLLTLPSRGMRLNVDVPATLVLRHGPIITDSTMANVAKRDDWYNVLSPKIIGNVGIANHIGADYTPRSYYEEAWNYGASFMISKKMVKQIIEACGQSVFIPVLVAQKLPVWTDMMAYHSFAQTYFPHLIEGTDYHSYETWRTEEFGDFNTEHDWLGSDHFQQPLLDWIDSVGWSKANKTFAEEKILLVEQPFAVALCTGIRYTGIGSDNPAPDEAYLPGVEWIVQDEYAQMAIDKGIEFNELDMESVDGEEGEWEYRK